MISFDNVSKFILSNINIHIPKGSVVGLVGASGAGKTTFLRLACGFLQADVGKVYIDGNEQKSFSVDKTGKIGALFADRPLFSDSESVCSNFEALRIAHGISKWEFEYRYFKLASELGFDKFDGQKISSLSLGQRRRAELGAVLLHNPEVLILDEPTSGLDENAKDVLRKIIEKRAAEGVTVIISSHALADISQVCNRIAFLDKGRLLYYGSEELFIRQFVPMDVMNVKLEGGLPDLEDLPVDRYFIENNVLTIKYNSNYITSAEILRTIVLQTKIAEVNISKADIEDAILKIERDKENE